MIIIVLVCLLAGGLVGLLAGLLGIGGGTVIVPILLFLLPSIDVVHLEHSFTIAVATSLASIIFTTFSSALTHYKQQGLDLHLTTHLGISVALGSVFASSLAEFIPVAYIKLLFAGVLIFAAIRMLFSSKKNTTTSTHHKIATSVVYVVGGITGIISSLIGIGGGILIIPILTWLGLPMLQAIGSAAACSVVIAGVSSIIYIGTGLDEYSIRDGFLGYVYLPALFGIISVSIYTAKIGAKLAHQLPIPLIKKLFAVLLISVAIKIYFD